MSALDGIFHIAGSVNNLKPFLTSTTNGAFPPLILRRRDDRRVVVRLRGRLRAIACPQRPHIFFFFGGGGKETTVFIPFYCLRRTASSSTGSAPSACSATTPSSTWWSGWTWAGGSGGRAAHRGTTPLFIHGRHRIGVRDVANPSTSCPFLSIFIEQIQPSP